MSGALKLCTRCKKPEIEANRKAMRAAAEARRRARCRRRWLGLVQEYSEATGDARIVLMVLASMADSTGWVSCPIPRLSFLCRLTESTTRRRLRELIAQNEIHVVQTGSGPGVFPAWRIAQPCQP